MPCATPLVAWMSGRETLAPPTRTSPSTVLSILTACFSSRVGTSAGRSMARTSAAVNLPRTTWCWRISGRSGSARICSGVLPLSARKAWKAASVGAKTVKGPGWFKSTAAASAATTALTAATRVSNSSASEARVSARGLRSSALAAASVAAGSAPGSVGWTITPPVVSGTAESSPRTGEARAANAAALSARMARRRSGAMVDASADEVGAGVQSARGVSSSNDDGDIPRSAAPGACPTRAAADRGASEALPFASSEEATRSPPPREPSSALRPNPRDSFSCHQLPRYQYT